ncbi:hypothetical protein GCM10023195_14280 [Actinoallomurus liliacearum]|uniref:Uncharacterized protein n=1 Tax=Actinoallomurus liliacearum TaxID=1080073 RepID=A0ABP8TC92_9ACTN
MSDETTPRPGDMRFDDAGEILVFDGVGWIQYRRIPVPGAESAFRRGEPRRSGDDAEPADAPAADADE